MGRRKTIAVAAVLAVVLVGAGAAYAVLASSVETSQLAVQDQVESEETQEGGDTAEAPDFVVYDSGGSALTLSSLEGTPVVLNFWASWCGPCQSEMPHFEEAYQELGDSVQFLMVNLTDGSRETIEIATAYIEEGGYTFPVVFDTDSEAAIAYGVSSIPATYFIDAEGTVVARASGAIDAETLQQGIGMIAGA